MPEKRGKPTQEEKEMNDGGRKRNMGIERRESEGEKDEKKRF